MSRAHFCWFPACVLGSGCSVVDANVEACSHSVDTTVRMLQHCTWCLRTVSFAASSCLSAQHQ